MFFNFVILLSTISNIVLLPPINNIYCATINIPIIGKQNIEYERLSQLKSEIRMSGIINDKAYITYDLVNNSNKLYTYTLDDKFIKILKKYKCELSNAEYCPLSDLSTINVFVKLINFNKIIVLKNKNLLQ